MITMAAELHQVVVVVLVVIIEISSCYATINKNYQLVISEIKVNLAFFLYFASELAI